LRFNDQPFLFKVPGCGLNSDANSLKSIWISWKITSLPF
jgi:hypothetical protein